jgi:long-chain acyl-CoA synthetase
MGRDGSLFWPPEVHYSATMATSDVAEQIAQRIAGATIPSLLLRNATDFGDLPALTMDEETLTWSDLRDRIADMARGLAAIGVQPRDRVLIMMSSRPEHWLVDLATVHLGAIPSTVYATLSPDQVSFLARHSRPSVVVLEGAAQLGRWRSVLSGPHGISAIITVDDMGAGFETLARVAENGKALHAADPDVFEKGWREIEPHQPVTVLYTSGTTGDPKGVAISHHNVLCQAAVLEATIEVPDHAPSVAYLPLAHIAERMLGIYNAVYRAGHVHICPDPTQVLAMLQRVRPVSFFGVPRIWEKVAAGVQARLPTMDESTQAAFAAAMEISLSAYRHREAGTPVPDELAERFAVSDAKVLAPVRAMLGLDRARWTGSGAAPIPVEILTFLAGIGLDVLEVWGMTETTGTATINTPQRFRTGTVGRVNPGMELRIADDGEILVRGPLVCLGYLEPDGTVAPATDADGWLATGDVGVLDDDGFLAITDRKKELIITSAGKNIAPSRIESLVRADPLVGYVVAIGDRRPYVTALVVLDEEMAPIWARSEGLGELTYTELTQHLAVRARVQAAVDSANEKLSRPESVKRFTILPTPWTAETGELTPKLSLRRAVISQRYAALIDELYAG